jgi:hypothetical protein
LRRVRQRFSDWARSDRLAHKEERGQAHLPNLELIIVDCVISAGKAFNLTATEQLQESRGQEGGLAPALLIGSKRSDTVNDVGIEHRSDWSAPA